MSPSAADLRLPIAVFIAAGRDDLGHEPILPNVLEQAIVLGKLVIDVDNVRQLTAKIREPDGRRGVLVQRDVLRFVPSFERYLMNRRRRKGDVDDVGLELR